MRSKLFTWLSHRLLRLGIAGFLACLLVAGVALKSGEFFHPKPVHAALINIPSEYIPVAKLVTNCVLMFTFNAGIAYVAGAPVAVFRAALYPAQVARVAIAVNETIQELRIAQLEITAANIVTGLSTVSPNLVKLNAVNGCLGITAFIFTTGISQFVWGDSDPMGAASALAADTTVLCRNVPGATLSPTTLLCQRPDGSYVEPDGTEVGSLPCSLIPGTGTDPASDLCSDFGGDSGTAPPTYYSPYGDRLGQCVTGYPAANAICTDGNGQFYNPDGTSLTPPSQPSDPCSDYVLGGGSTDPCDYGTIGGSSTPTATPQPPPSDPAGTWNYTINYPSPDNTVTYQSGTMTITAGNPYTASCTVSPESPYTKMQACTIELDNPNQWQRRFVITPGSSTFMLRLTGGAGYIQEYFLFGPIALSGTSETTSAGSETGMAGYILTMNRA